MMDSGRLREVRMAVVIELLLDGVWTQTLGPLFWTLQPAFPPQPVTSHLWLEHKGHDVLEVKGGYSPELME